jgi:hypothetical protein
MAGDGRLSFTPSPQIVSYLRQLKRKGFYGKKMGDVINQIVNNEVKQLLKDNLLDRLPQQEEGTDEEEDDSGP